jgi:RimJ/RimL family protein N-acetyltransferase
LQATDFDALYEVGSDPLIWEQHPETTRWQRPVFEKFFAEAIESRGALLVTDLATGAAIGSSRYFGHDLEKREVEIGWSFLARPYWGGSYNREMKDLMMRHAFQFVDRVIFLVGPDNLRSQKALLKLGAEPIGPMHNNTGRPSVGFALSAQRWLQQE